MEYLLQVFGGMRLDTAVLLIAALIFMWKIYKKVEMYFKDKYVIEFEKEKQMKDILGQVQQYPKWREQSIERQKEFSSEINDLRNTQKEIIKELKDIEERRKRRREMNCVIGYFRVTAIIPVKTRIHCLRGQKWNQMLFGKCLATMKKRVEMVICILQYNLQ